MPNTDLLRLNHVTKEYKTSGGPLTGKSVISAVEGLSVRLEPGEVTALVGESGCGKSTTARIALGLIEPTSGSVECFGENVHRLSRAGRKAFHRRVQIIFQDPSGALNPRKTVYRTIRDPLHFHGLVKRGEMRSVVAEWLERVGLSPAAAFIDRYPHQLSGGQKQRLVIARAISLEPAVIVADEPVSALDVSIQAQILELLKDLQRETNVGLLFITHDLAVVRSLAQYVAVMYLGRIVESGPVDDILDHPQHPYTRALLSATLSADPIVSRARLRDIELIGSPNSAKLRVGQGCAYRPRCPISNDQCETVDPKLLPRGLGEVACHNVQIRDVAVKRN